MCIYLCIYIHENEHVCCRCAYICLYIYMRMYMYGTYVKKSMCVYIYIFAYIYIYIYSYDCILHTHIIYISYFICKQCGKNVLDASICRFLFAKKPLITGIICRKEPVEIRRAIALGVLLLYATLHRYAYRFGMAC